MAGKKTSSFQITDYLAFLTKPFSPRDSLSILSSVFFSFHRITLKVKSSLRGNIILRISPSG